MLEVVNVERHGLHPPLEAENVECQGLQTELTGVHQALKYVVRATYHHYVNHSEDTVSEQGAEARWEHVM